MPSRAFLTRCLLKTLQKVPIYVSSVLEGLKVLGGAPKPVGPLNLRGNSATVSYRLRRLSDPTPVKETSHVVGHS